MAAKKTNIAPSTEPTASPPTPASATAKPLNADPAHCEPCPPKFRIDTALRWRGANSLEQKVLENLQGNILKGHGRDHTTMLFVEYGTDALKVRRALRQLGNFHVTSAYKQLLATDAFKKSKKDGGTFCSVFISASGYSKLGTGAFVTPPGNKAFSPGMKASTSLSNLGDPPIAKWEAGLRKPLDGMILVADDDEVRGAAASQTIEKLLTDAGCKISHRQIGKAIRNAAGNGLEHFGYVDGRSQPLMLIEDIETESREEGLVQWDPTSPLNKALVADPLANDQHNLSFGSFFIFRKLEQHVRAFKAREQALADALGLQGDARELAGALVVGRFEDGTPVTLSNEAAAEKNPKNDFNYDADNKGARCPFHAHIRKTNPRGSGGFGELLDAEQMHIMARRGITYEDKPRVHPDDLPEASNLAEFNSLVAPLLPEGDVGLLFMAYNSKLDDQFVFTQQSWANNPAFPKAPAPGPGFDGVIAQAPPGSTVGQTYPKKWDDTSGGTKGFDFKGFVQMKGGEYFFAPSLKFLRGV